MKRGTGMTHSVVHGALLLLRVVGGAEVVVGGAPDTGSPRTPRGHSPRSPPAGSGCS